MKKWFPTWVIPMLIVAAFTTVWLRLSVVQSTYELNQKAKIIHNLKLEHERLSLNLAQLRSPRHLEMLARKKFNLHPPRANQLIHLKD